MKKPIHASTESPILSRVTDLLIKKGISQKQLLAYLGLTKGIYTEWKANRSDSYLKYIDQIATFLGTSPTYLLRGDSESEVQLVEADDETSKLTKRERELVQLYRCISADSKNKLVMTARALANLERKSIK